MSVKRLACSVLSVWATVLNSWLIAIAACVCCECARALEGRPGGVPLPLESVYSIPDLMHQDIAAAPNGQSVAYVVRRLPPDATIAGKYRWQASGAPSSVVGCELFLADVSGNSSVRLAQEAAAAWRPAWSPDGRTLAFYADTGGQVSLWTYVPQSGEYRRWEHIIVKPKHWIGDEPQWSPDSKTIYVPVPPEGRAPGYERREASTVWTDKPTSDRIFTSGTERPAEGKTSGADTTVTSAHYLVENNSGIAAVDAETGALRIVVPADATPRPAVFRVSASGRWISYLSVWTRGSVVDDESTRQNLAVVDVQLGAVRTIAENLPHTEKDYFRLTYAWHPTADRLVFIKDGELNLVEFDSGGPTKPVRIGAEAGELALGIHWFSRDGTSVIAGTAPRASGARSAGSQAPPHGLALIPVNGGPVRRVAVDPQQWEFLEVIKADARTFWQPEPNTVSYLVRNIASGEVSMMKHDFATDANVSLWSGRARIRSLRPAADGIMLFGAYEDLSTPPDVFRFAADFSTKKRISRLAPELDRVAPPRLEMFNTRVPLHDHTFMTVRTAVLLPPDFRPDQPPPAIVTFYPDNDASTQIDSFGGGNRAGIPAWVFTSRGYAVLYPHVKTGPGGRPGNVVDEMIDSLLPQVYRAGEKGLVDITRLALHGNSFGGYATAAIVSQTNLFRAGIPTNGIYDLVSHTYGRAPDGSVAWTENRQPRLGAPLWSAPQKYLAASPVYVADKIKTPLLLLQGGEDILKAQSEEFFTALRRLDKPAQLAIYAGGGHWLSAWPRQQAVDATERVLEFLGRHLKHQAEGEMVPDSSSTGQPKPTSP